MKLAKKKCIPCEGGAKPLSKRKIAQFLKILPEWILRSRGKWIRRKYRMKNFASAIEIIQKIACAAELAGHHPDLHLTRYRELVVDLSTHAVGGLTENDFILAAQIESMDKKLML